MHARAGHRSRKRQTVFVGSKIRQIRKERGLTQAVLASKIGIQQSDLCRMENGEYKVSLDALFKILGVFGMEIGAFFDNNPESVQGGPWMDREVLSLFHALDLEAREEVLEFLRLKANSQAGESKGNH